MRRILFRLLGRPLAAACAATAVLGLLTSPPRTAEPAPAVPAAASETTATVFYYTKTRNWSSYSLHYAPDKGAWTTVPGVPMEAACPDWVKRTVDLGGASGLAATFTDGAGVWDNNAGKNYALGTGAITVKDGVVAHSDPCGGGTEPDPDPGGPHTASVYYSTTTVGWSTTNLHYRPAGGTWTAVPGVGMEAACTGWMRRSVDLDAATTMLAAFNNGNGVWDHNNGADYAVPAGLTTVKDRKVTAGAQDPCAAGTPDTQAPTAPSKVSASADGVSVVLTWAPATDDRGVTEYFVFGEVAAFVNDKWNRGSVNHSAQFYTWKERKEYSADDGKAALEMYDYEQRQGTGSQPTSTNAFLEGNTYHAPDHSRFSGMNVIDMRMHMNFGDANNAYDNGKDSDDSYNDATYNVVYVDSHDYGPNKSGERYSGGTDAWAENMSLMWTFRGIPTLYYGSEIEFQAGKKIDCGPTCPLATTGRAYYGAHLAGDVEASEFGTVDSATGAVAGTLAQPLVKHVQRLNRIRRAVPALQMGQYSTEGITGSMAYKRRYTDAASGTDSFALVTVTGGATYTGIPDGTYKDAVTGDTQVVTGGRLTVPAPGKGNLRVYVLDLGGRNAAPGKIGTAGPYLR
ncbi:carbohydrate binding domain-containing protein [Streptomyces sp. NPDC005899]|uniref:carbohydrate binding domain-containing protein n=1 Tax=Streptomyces sp. NPDC005899 TaxID=3155716 RepID=UPI0033DDAA53